MKKSIALLSLLVLGASSFNAIAKEETKKEATKGRTVVRAAKASVILGAYVAAIYTAHKYVDGQLPKKEDKSPKASTIKDVYKAISAVFLLKPMEDVVKEYKELAVEAVATTKEYASSAYAYIVS